MSRDGPVLSVVMASYNHGHYIGGALRSILSQSRRAEEVIVVDDGSSDDSIRVIQKIANADPSVRVLRNDCNTGVCASITRGLETASGSYVHFSSADDRVLPGFFEKSLAMLERFPHAGLCCSDPASFEGDGDCLIGNRMHWSEEAQYFSPEALAEVIRGGYIPGHTAIVRRTALLEAGGFLPKLRWHCDWFAWLVVAFRMGLCYVPEGLAALRVQPGSYSERRRDGSSQCGVLLALADALKSDTYRDVLPFFVRGSVFTHFGDDVVRAVMSEPRTWDVETLMLIQEPLFTWNRRLRAHLDEAWRVWERETASDRNSKVG